MSVTTPEGGSLCTTYPFSLVDSPVVHLQIFDSHTQMPPSELYPSRTIQFLSKDRHQEWPLQNSTAVANQAPKLFPQMPV